MTHDLLTVIWKEMKEFGRQPGSRLRMALTAVIPVLYFGVVGPLTAGERWIDAPDVIFIAILVPLVVIMMTAPDSFAGERERKTLKTLLATRLGDRSILYGKLLFNIMLGWSLALATLTMALVTYNIANWSGVVQFFDLWTGFVATAVSLLMAVVTAGAGVLVSLRSGNVQQAQQLLAAALLLVPTIAGPVFLIFAKREGSWLREALDSLDGEVVAIWGMSILTVVGIIIVLTATVKFRRPRLHLLD